MSLSNSSSGELLIPSNIFMLCLEISHALPRELTTAYHLQKLI